MLYEDFYSESDLLHLKALVLFCLEDLFAVHLIMAVYADS